MKASKYLEAFKQADKTTFQLTGGFILVEKIPQEEMKRASGLVMPITASNQVNSIGANLPTFVHVLAVGEGYYDDATKESIPPSTQVGDILLLGQTSVKWFPVLEVDNYQPFEIGLTDESEAQLKFKGIEAYQRFVESINKKA